MVGPIAIAFFFRANIKVMDNTGRVVMNNAQPNGTLDISNLKEGIYIMMLHTENGVYTSRVVKQ